MDRLTLLQAFVRLADEGSFTAVARELRVKQSTVSKWLTALEEELGVRLIDRTTRSQRLTDAGTRFYADAQRVLTTYDEAVADARSTAPTLQGRIRISLPTVFGARYVIPAVTRFVRQHDAIDVDAVFSDRYVSLVEEGFDVAVRIGQQVDSTLRSHAMGDSPRRLVASPGYLKTHGMPESVRDLESHECLVHTEPGARAVWRFQQDGRWHKASVRGRVSANHSEATLSMAKSGLGICLLASWLVDKEIRAGRLVRILEQWEPPRAPIRALTAPGKYVPPRLRAFLEHLKAELERTL